MGARPRWIGKGCAMRVGPQNWRAVTTDTAGVPHGGDYGNVRWFEREANKNRMKIAWSRRYRCFLLYTEPYRGRCICQMLFRKFVARGWGRPVAMTQELLRVMIHLRNEDAKMGAKTIMQKIALREKHQREAVVKEWDQADEDLRPEIIRRVDLRMDPSSRSVMALPQQVGLYRRPARRRAERRRKKLEQKGRILVP